MVSGTSLIAVASVPPVPPVPRSPRDEETVFVLRPDSVRPADQRLSIGKIGRSAAFVALWMVIGVVFRIVKTRFHVRWLDENAYLVAGVPLTVVWQLAVRRRPLLELWVDRWSNHGRGWGRVAIGVVVGGAAAVLPVWMLLKTWTQVRHEPAMLAWNVCAIGGAAGVGYATSKLRAQDAGNVFGSLGTAGLVGSGLMVGFALLRVYMLHQSLPHLAPALKVAGESFALYVPICFLLEEVSFRGLVDADVRDGRTIEGLAMAAFSSVLWGLWHVPIAPVTKPIEFASVSIVYPVLHALIGIPLALWYRRSGNLLVPTLTHAFIDALRNALQSG